MKSTAWVMTTIMVPLSHSRTIRVYCLISCVGDVNRVYCLISCLGDVNRVSCFIPCVGDVNRVYCLIPGVGDINRVYCLIPGAGDVNRVYCLIPCVGDVNTYNKFYVFKFRRNLSPFSVMSVSYCFRKEKFCPFLISHSCCLTCQYNFVSYLLSSLGHVAEKLQVQ